MPDTPTEAPLIQLTEAGPHWRLTLNRPRALNALSPELLSALDEAIAQVARARPAPRLLSICGAGRAFAAGADVAAMARLDTQALHRYIDLGQRVFNHLEALPLVVLAEVHGFALGGGCELALACDLIYADAGALFGQPEVCLGIVPGFGGSQRLPARIGLGAARELIYTGRRIDAQEAARLGLVDKVCPEDGMDAAATALLHALQKAGPHAVGQAKALLQHAVHRGLADGLQGEQKAFNACLAHPERREGMTAFVEKRPPRFDADTSA
ncbi:MAG: enoyl-CoA hydratase/isomerase family protein [Polyangiales bacterium]